MAASNSALEMGSDSLDRTCDVCTHRTLVAISYCEKCQLALCKACDQKHRTGKPTRDHTLLTGDQLLSLFIGKRVPDSMVCEKHQMTFKYFCKADNMVCCHKCKTASHNDCDVTDISNHTIQNDPTKAFQRVQEKMRALETWYETVRKKKNKNKATLKLQIKKCQVKITNIRKEFSNLLEELESKLVEEIKAVEERIDKELDDHISIADDMLNKIRDKIEKLKQCEDTGQKDAMFVSMKKTECDIPEYRRVIENVEREHGDLNIQLRQNSLVTKCLNELNTFGHVEQIDYRRYELSSPNMAVTDIERYDVDCEQVQSIVAMPDGHVVLACAQHGLKLLDESFHEEFHLSVRAITACKFSDTEVLVSLGKDKQLKVVKILPRVLVKRNILLKRECTGVDFHNDEIYVTCHNNPGDGEVRVLTKTGEFKRRLGFIDGKYIFTCPVGVKVTNDGSKLFVNDDGDNTLTCLDKRGRVMYKLCDSDLIAPFGMCLGPLNNLLFLVIRHETVIVNVITPDGQKHGTNLSKIKVIGHPICLTYSNADGCLALGCYCADKRSLAIVRFDVPR